MEDYVYVLDYLPKGRGDVPPHKRNPVVYGIGENQFTFLELIPRHDTTFITGERIYVGKDAEKRKKIEKLSKAQQVSMLYEYNLKRWQVNELSSEESRINKIIELQNKKRKNSLK